MRRSISRIISDLAAGDPERVVVIADDGILTADALERAANRLTRDLHAHGVARDDLVAVTLPNGCGFVVACAAVWKAGATPLPIGADRTLAQRSAIAAIARPTAAIGLGVGVAGVPTIADPFVALGADDPPPDAWARSWKAPTSSGSTGTPKVVVAAAPALFDPTRQVAPFLPREGVQLVAGPLSHSAVFTYAMRGLLTGQRLVVHPRFDARRWVEAVRVHGVTWALVVPTTMHRLLRLESADRDSAALDTLTHVVHIGARCSPDLKRAFLDWLGPQRVIEVYAGSESNGLTMITGDDWLQHPGSVGRPIGGTEIEIRRADGTPAPAGETGMVWMRRGESAAYDYLGGRSLRESNGWDTLGDLGSLDADGWLFLADRADDVIVNGGEKIYPAEVEHALERHPDVRSAVVFGIPDVERGALVGAVVEIADSAADEASIRSWLAGHLDPARVPARILIRSTPVRSDAGKTNRRAWSELLTAKQPDRAG